MSVCIAPENVFEYFNDRLCHTKAEMLNSICFARCVRFIGGKTRRHNYQRICCYFKC